MLLGWIIWGDDDKMKGREGQREGERYTKIPRVHYVGIFLAYWSQRTLGINFLDGHTHLWFSLGSL